jgi:Flp pilus assembly pilin Flp
MGVVACRTTYLAVQQGSTVRTTGAGAWTRRLNRDQPEERDAMSRLLLKWTRAIGDRTRARYDDRGAGFVEYAGLLLLIATIVSAVMLLDLDTDIGNFIQDQVNAVFNSDG